MTWTHTGSAAGTTNASAVSGTLKAYGRTVALYKLSAVSGTLKASVPSAVRTRQSGAR